MIHIYTPVLLISASPQICPLSLQPHHKSKTNKKKTKQNTYTKTTEKMHRKIPFMEAEVCHIVVCLTTQTYCFVLFGCRSLHLFLWWRNHFRRNYSMLLSARIASICSFKSLQENKQTNTIYALK